MYVFIPKIQKNEQYTEGSSFKEKALTTEVAKA